MNSKNKMKRSGWIFQKVPSIIRQKKIIIFAENKFTHGLKNSLRIIKKKYEQRLFYGGISLVDMNR